jgi:hypothetical protein
MSNIGTFKRFVTNVAILAMPNLIAFDLVITKPMASRVGFLTYLKYQYSSDKGGVEAGRDIQTPFNIRGTDNDFTSRNVTERYTATAATAAAFQVNWRPITPIRSLPNGATVGGFTIVNITAGTTGSAGPIAGALPGLAAAAPGTLSQNPGAGVANIAGTITGTVNYATGEVTIASGISAGDTFTVSYEYDNITIPAEKLPMLKVTQESITLEAKLRRIAIYYSTIAAMSAKIDYDIDLQAELVKKAQAQMSYEIDGDIVSQLAAAAVTQPELTWSKSLPVGVSKTEHYMGFTEIVSKASSYIFHQTGKFMATWMVIGSQVKPILDFIPGFAQQAQGNKVGPFLCGTLNGMQVFIDPRMPQNEYFFGVKGADLETAAAVYAPYIPLAPTMLLEGPDHGATQGWATMYDFKIINPNLLVKGAITA